MPFDSRLEADAAGFHLDAALDWSAGGQFRASGVFQPSVMSLEGIERLATFGYRTHALTCCPCGEDHSGELLAHKISIVAGAGTAASSIVPGSVQYAPPGSPEAQTFNLAGEVDGSTATTVTLAVGDSVNSQIEASLDQDWYRITLQAGVTYEFRLTKTGASPLGDPYLELMNAAGAQVKFNDDGAGNFNSLLRYTPTSTGTFYLNAHGYVDPATSQSSTGSYTLTTGIADPFPTWTVDQIANYLVNESAPGLGPRWQTSTITYNIEDLTGAEQTLAERALQMWSAASSLNFVRTTGSASIIFVNSVADDPASRGDTDPAAYARTSSSGNSITSSRIVISSNWATSQGGTAFDSYMQQTYIHEVGHALGLSHSGPYDGSAEYGTDNLYTNDNWAYTVMSYFNQMEAGHGNYRYVLGLQQADIAAIQLLYGTNPSGTYAGNTTFGFNSSAPGTNIDWSQFVLVQPEGTYRRPPAMTLYDTSGVDTINLSGFAQPQVVDLRPGTYSSLGDRPDPSIPHYVNVVAIAANTIIENVIGGSGNDTITGNTADNQIAGGGGNDRITLGTGADIVVYTSGGGFDTVTDFSLAQDRIDLTAFSSATVTAAFNGRTSSSGGTLISLSSGEGVVLLGISPGQLTMANLILASNSNAIYGSSAADRMDGTNGSDELHGLGGNDYILGYAGNDFLYGDDGDDTIDGGAGNDAMDGGAGGDVFYVTNGDSVVGGTGRDTIIVVDALGTGYILNMGTSGVERVQATSLGDVIDASTSSDWVQIYAGGGADTITGSAFGDVINIVSAEATINAGGGRDTIVFDVFDGTGISINLGAMNAESFIGRGGNDTINASTTTDWVSIYTGGGNDIVTGSAFGDSIYLESTTVSVNAGAGRDFIVYNVFDGSGISVNLGAMNAEGFVGRAGNDTINAATATDWVSVYTGGGVDTVTGSGFGDSIYLESTSVTVNAGAGRDYIIYNIFDGSGISVNLGAMGAEGFIGRGGNDTINAATTTDWVSIYTGGGVDTVTGSGFGDSIYLGSATVTVNAGAGFDWIVYDVFDGSGVTLNLTTMQAEGFVGRNGNDSITAAGTATAVTLYGEGGNDILVGGNGRDSIFGGAGNDTLTGNAGGDYFVFQGAWGTDTVTDFAAGSDILIVRVTGLSGFGQLGIIQDGLNAVISYGGQTLTLNGVTAASLSGSNFIFEPSAGQEAPDPHAPSAEAPDTFDFSQLADTLDKPDAPVMEPPGAAQRWTNPQNQPLAESPFTDLGPHTFDFAERLTDGLDWNGV